MAKGYTWTLTITLVLATYGLADLAGLSAAITIFVFGIVLGNALLLDRRQSDAEGPVLFGPGHYLQRARVYLHLRTDTLDIAHIEQVQREVSFFASAFFFVYLGLLFDASVVSAAIVASMIIGAVAMLALRYAFLPILYPYFDHDPDMARVERGIVAFNISRGLAAAVIATIPLSYGIDIPGFLDAMFFGILFSNVISTVGIFLLYRRRDASSDARSVPTTS